MKKKLPYLILVLVGLISFCIYLLSQPRSSPSSVLDQQPATPASPSTLDAPPSTLDSNSDESIRSRQRLLSLRKGQKPNLPCLKSLRKFCYLQQDDPLFVAMQLHPHKEGVFFAGKKVFPKNIFFQVTFETYLDETLTDVAGQTISSTKKEYDESVDTLIFSIGVPEDYYKLISDDQRNDLYMSQLIRSLFAMAGQPINDFSKVFSIVKSIDSWYPEIRPNTKY